MEVEVAERHVCKGIMANIGEQPLLGTIPQAKDSPKCPKIQRYLAREILKNIQKNLVNGNGSKSNGNGFARMSHNQRAQEIEKMQLLKHEEPLKDEY